MTLFSMPKLKAPTFFNQFTFEVTTYCNLDCPGCGRTIDVRDGTVKSTHMSAEMCQKIVDHIPQTNVAILQNGGEPTLNPDHMNICEITRKSGKIRMLHYHTNGITRDVDYLQKTLDYVNFFSVSVDTLNPAYVDLTRKGTDVNKLHSRLSEICRRKLPFRVVMVASRYNFMDIPSTLKILNDIGPINVIIQHFHGKDDITKVGQLTVAERDLLKKVLDELQVFLPNISLTFTDSRNGLEDNKICTSPAFDPAVTPDGYLAPCCAVADPRLFGYANLAERTFEDIWYSDPVQSYLRRYLEQAPDECIGCPANGRVRIGMDRDSLVREGTDRILTPAVNFALSLGDREQAEVICREFIQNADATPGALYDLGQVLVMGQKFEEALQIHDRLQGMLGDIPLLAEFKARIPGV